MKKIILLVLLSLCLISCSRSDVTLHDTQNNIIHLAELKGKWIIINYWASWCPSCAQEIPELNDFNKKYKDKNVVLYGVNYDRLSLDELNQAVRRMEITFPVLIEDPSTVWRLDVVGVVPTTFIIDPNGQMVRKIEGPVTEQSLSDLVQQLQK